MIIPAYNEEASIAGVVRRVEAAVPAGFEHRTIVTDNSSTDQTAFQARQAGAEVVREGQRGYGIACLTAIKYLGNWPDLLLFLDADGSSRPEEMGRLLEPIGAGQADLVIGFRPSNAPMTPPQRWGTRLATRLIRLRWGHVYRDIGPFRAICYESYSRLGMRDRTWGWTVEMQILSLLRGLRVREVPVSWERRLAGVSKISGTFSGVLRAGGRILWTIFRYSCQPRQTREQHPRGQETRN